MRTVSLILKLRSLSLFAALRKDPVLGALEQFLVSILVLEQEYSGKSCPPQFVYAAAETWAAYTQALLTSGSATLRDHMTALVERDENSFTLQAEKSQYAALPDTLCTAAAADLIRLRQLAEWNCAEALKFLVQVYKNTIDSESAVLLKEESKAFIKQEPSSSFFYSAESLAERIHKSGAGVLGQAVSFLWEKNETTSCLQPIRCPDHICLDDLSRYEEQRSVLISNTKRFLDAKPANNILLYGDRGTGKSASVKAVCNSFASRGLRLVEVRKKDLLYFSELLDLLSKRACFFVIFIDDLSFEKTDDSFTGLKALLEGGAERRPDNVVVYATSNRRHLVKERFQDRPDTAQAAAAASSGDVRAFDSMQEQLSLADRFGITVVFSAPSQEEYLTIAEFLAEKNGLLPSGMEGRSRFRADALRWERWFNGRSPRSAKQFVDWLAGGEDFPWESGIT